MYVYIYKYIRIHIDSYMYMHVYITTGSRPLHHSSVSLTLCRCTAVLWFSLQDSRISKLDRPRSLPWQARKSEANGSGQPRPALEVHEPPKLRRWHQQLFWSTQRCGYERMHFYNIHVYIYIYTKICVHIYNINIYIHIHKWMNIYIFIYIYTYIKNKH